MIAEGQNAFGEDEAKSCGCDQPLAPLDETSETLYHMAQKDLWEKAKVKGETYYAPSFKESGNITRSSIDSGALLKIANIAYKSLPGEWVCIALDRRALAESGADVRVEPCEDVGGIGESCRQIHGGIPTDSDKVVTSVYPMTRLVEDGTFVAVRGLTNDDTPDHFVEKQDLLRRFI